MAAGRRGLDSGRENAGASSRRLEEVEGEVRGAWAREIEERRPELVGAAMGASSARLVREEDEKEKGNTTAGEDKAGYGVTDRGARGTRIATTWR